MTTPPELLCKLGWRPGKEVLQAGRAGTCGETQTTRQLEHGAAKHRRIESISKRCGHLDAELNIALRIAQHIHNPFLQAFLVEAEREAAMLRKIATVEFLVVRKAKRV